MTEQPAHDAALDSLTAHFEAEWCDQVHDDVVVIAGVEGDIVAARFGDGAHHIQSLVSVEGSDLDGDDIVNFRKSPPE